jgi:cellulose biosynthesis protein BcsQ
VERSCLDSEGKTFKFQTEISRSVVIQEAQRVGKTIFQYQGDHMVTQEYRQLAREVEERLAQRSASTLGVQGRKEVANG